jgi:hypothetical protein
LTRAGKVYSLYRTLQQAGTTLHCTYKQTRCVGIGSTIRASLFGMVQAAQTEAAAQGKRVLLLLAIDDDMTMAMQNGTV